MKVKIFTGGITSNLAEPQMPGLNLTKQIDEWIESFEDGIQILSVETTTTPQTERSYGYIITTIIYKLNEIKNFKVEEIKEKSV